jgi:hypothetical protein
VAPVFPLVALAGGDGGFSMAEVSSWKTSVPPSKALGGHETLSQIRQRGRKNTRKMLEEDAR